jgi:hypothetical protein
MSVYKPDWLEAKQRMTDWWAGKKVDRVAASVKAPVKFDTNLAYINKSPEKYTDFDTVFNNLDLALRGTFWGGDAFPNHFIYFGPMYSVTHFGAEPQFMLNTTWYKPCFDNLDELMAYKRAGENKWSQLAADMRKKTVERSEGSYLVTTGGVCAIIDMIAGLIGNEKLLYAMADEPEKVIAARNFLAQWIKPTFDNSHNTASVCNDGGSIDWLGVWCPGRMSTNQCDFSVMISPNMFEKFVFEDLKALCDCVDYGIYHLDGEDEIKHLDSLFKLDKINMIQWIPANPDYADPLNWTGLFKRIQESGRKVFVNTPYGRVKELLNKIDRDLVYLDIWCPDFDTANKTLLDLER